MPDVLGAWSDMLEARDLACLRGERVVFSGLSFRLAPWDVVNHIVMAAPWRQIWVGRRSWCQACYSQAMIDQCFPKC